MAIAMRGDCATASCDLWRKIVKYPRAFRFDSGERSVTWNNMPKRWYEDYERGRPGYPAKAVEVAGLPSTATVLDLGAGTGKLTRLLVTTFARVVAVEPDDEMRRML